MTIRIFSLVAGAGLRLSKRLRRCSPRRPETSSGIRLRTVIGRIAFAIMVSMIHGPAFAAAQLTIDDGVVVKFGSDAGLLVRDGLQTGRHVVLTSVQDDSIGGRVEATPGLPVPGDWRGVTVEGTAGIGRLGIDRLEIRYAGGNGAAGLQLERSYTPRFLKVTDSLLGIRVLNGASPVFTGLSLLRNQTGLESSGASPTVTASEISGSLVLGISNLTPGTALVHADRNWWGSTLGPQAPGNPDGLGDAVSTGVDYGTYETVIPLIDCSIESTDGTYTVVQPQVSLALECRNAIEYRLASSGEFGSAPFHAMAPAASFTLPGNGAIHAEFRAQTGNTTTKQSNPFVYVPDVPVVTIETPPVGATLSIDTLISARATDSIGIDRVEFSYLDGMQGEHAIAAVPSGIDGVYETLWSLDGVMEGDYTLKVVAISSRAQTAVATRAVTIRRAGGDTLGPVIDDVRFNGSSLTSGMILRTSGTLSFSASDPSGVASMSARFDGVLLDERNGVGHYEAYLDLQGVSGSHEITLEAVDSIGNASEQRLAIEVVPAPVLEAPTVEITAPAANAAIQYDTTIRANVEGAAIRQVDFYAGSAFLGSVSAPPYEREWQIGGAADGAHELKVVATNTAGQTGQATRSVTVVHPDSGSDTSGPSIFNPLFGSVPLRDGMTLTGAGTVAFSVSDRSGVASAAVRLDAQPVSGSLSGSVYTAPLSLVGLADGRHTLTLQATNERGYASEAEFSILVDTALPLPPPPTVTISAPSGSDPISADTDVVANATGANLQRVDFYVDTQWIGSASAEPYRVTWGVGGFADGVHVLKAVATDGWGQTGLARFTVRLQRVSSDTTGPEIGSILFAGHPLNDGDPLAAPGLLTFGVTDASGVARVDVKLGTKALAGGGLSAGRYSVLLDPAVVDNGTHDLSVHAVDTIGNSSDRIVQGLGVQIPVPPAPLILAPGSPARVTQPQVAISGTAQAGSKVRLRLNGGDVGAPIPATFDGAFAGMLTLPGEGDHVVTATAENERGIGAASAPVSVTYSAPVPSVVITQPVADALIDTGDAGQIGVAVEASIVDTVGLSSVEFSVDGQPVGTPLANAPYAWTWNAASATSGEEAHVLRVKATNRAGKTAIGERTVKVRRNPPPPPPPQTAYVGRIQSIDPPMSFGEEPILISGSAVDHNEEKVANALLKIVLQVGGFQRRITTSTDAEGNFVFRFVPQGSDAGTYKVSAIHPDQTTLPDQGQFTINRLTLSPTRYALQAVRTVPATIRVMAKASAGSGANGVRFVNPDVPSGISVVPAAPVNVPPGGQGALEVTFTGDGQTGESGTVVLVAEDGEGKKRGEVVVDYVLHVPRPLVMPQPKSVQTSVGKNAQVLESVQLANKGYSAATGIQVQLLAKDWATGTTSPPPTWISLERPTFSELGVGEMRALHVVAKPLSDVAEGVYSFVLQVQDANGVGGDVPVTVSVTPDCSQGAATCQGGIRLHVSDIYTKTFTEGGAIIEGVQGASVRLQREIDYKVVASSTTDANGEVEISDLPIGHYRYLASAPNHVSASGRVTVRPGQRTSEEVFLDYELVTFEWNVTETTIEDRYDVTLTAIFQTQVPAPVVLIEPTSINLPDMQEGEDITGEITITNRGLIRADNVVWTPAKTDAYYEYQYMGAPPESLGPRESVRIPYRVIKKAEALPGIAGGASFRTLAGAGAFQSVKAGASTSSGGCRRYGNPMRVNFGYQCAAGVDRNGAAGAGFSKVYGQCGGNQVPGKDGIYGQIWWLGWVGEQSSSAQGTPMSSGPGCVPVCPDCNGGGPGG